MLCLPNKQSKNNIRTSSHSTMLVAMIQIVVPPPARLLLKRPRVVFISFSHSALELVKDKLDFAIYVSFELVKLLFRSNIDNNISWTVILSRNASNAIVRIKMIIEYLFDHSPTINRSNFQPRNDEPERNKWISINQMIQSMIRRCNYSGTQIKLKG